MRRGGYILLLGQEIYLGGRYDQQTVFLTDTLDGLEVRAPDGKVFLLPKYRKFIKPTYRTPARLRLHGRNKIAPMTADEKRAFYGEEALQHESDSPGIAVAR
ncbi:MAG TPA: hypothetical protein VGX03_20055 [Candidatus Binatia bacterium]|nr:hypothetical protein [Candidatus Binatia bacterium]